MLAHNYCNMITCCTILKERREEGRKGGRAGRASQPLSWAFHRHYFSARLGIIIFILQINKEKLGNLSSLPQITHVVSAELSSKLRFD